jgi:hypothetical protein
LITVGFAEFHYNFRPSLVAIVLHIHYARLEVKRNIILLYHHEKILIRITDKGLSGYK